MGTIKKKYLISIGFLFMILALIVSVMTVSNVTTARAASSSPTLQYEAVEINGVQGYRITQFQLIESPTVDLVISSANTPDGKPVLEIDSMAFSGSILNSITIEESVFPINIRTSAFNSSMVKKINLGNSVTFFDDTSDYIDQDSNKRLSTAVFASSDVQSITLPSNITTIGAEMFSYCRELAEIKAVNGVLNFLPEKVKVIGKDAFKVCQSIHKLIIPAGLKELEKNAFGEWTSEQRIGFRTLEISEDWKNQCGHAQIKASPLLVKFNDLYDEVTVDRFDNTLEFPIYSKDGYYFSKWKDDNNTVITDDAGKVTADLFDYEELNLVPHMAAMSCYIKFDKQGGVGGSNTLLYPFGSDFTFDAKSAPTRKGYNFKGYFTDANGEGTQYFDENMKMLKKWDIPQANTTLYAIWEGKSYFISLEQEGGSGGSGSIWATYNQPMPSATAPTRSKYIFKGYFTGKNGGGIQYYDSDMRSVRDWDRTPDGGPFDPQPMLYAHWEEAPKCVAEGTMITLSNGNQVAVEDLTGNEKLLVWNFCKGTFDTAPILFIDHESEDEYKVINLDFSDGTQVKVISEHGFYDFNLNKFIFLREDADQYIGHYFNKQKISDKGELIWTKVQLVNVTIQFEHTTTWSPVTLEHLGYYVNGMLSMPAATEGLINIFEVDCEIMQFNQKSFIADIEKYGLFTYEEFSERLMIPEKIFEAFNGQYLKISIGKGLIDWTTIEELVLRYSKYF